MTTRREFLSDNSHRIRFVYLPKHSSWLNQIEIFFGIVHRKCRRGGNFTSVPDLSPNSDSSSPTTTRPWPTPSTGPTPESLSRRDAAPISSRPTTALGCDASTNQEALPPHESSYLSCGVGASIIIGETGVSRLEDFAIGQEFSKFAPSLTQDLRPTLPLAMCFVTNDDTNRLRFTTSDDGLHWTSPRDVGPMPQTSSSRPAISWRNETVRDTDNRVILSRNLLIVSFISNDDTKQIMFTFTLFDETGVGGWSPVVHTGESGREISGMTKEGRLFFLSHDDTDRLLGVEINTPF